MKLIKLDSSDVEALDNISKTHPPNRFVYPAFGVCVPYNHGFLPERLLTVLKRSTWVSPTSNKRQDVFYEPNEIEKPEMMIACRRKR